MALVPRRLNREALSSAGLVVGLALLLLAVNQRHYPLALLQAGFSEYSINLQPTVQEVCRKKSLLYSALFWCSRTEMFGLNDLIAVCQELGRLESAIKAAWVQNVHVLHHLQCLIPVFSSRRHDQPFYLLDWISHSLDYDCSRIDRIDRIDWMCCASLSFPTDSWNFFCLAYSSRNQNDDQDDFEEISSSIQHQNRKLKDALRSIEHQREHLKRALRVIRAKMRTPGPMGKQPTQKYSYVFMARNKTLMRCSRHEGPPGVLGKRGPPGRPGRGGPTGPAGQPGRMGMMVGLIFIFRIMPCLVKAYCISPRLCPDGVTSMI